MARESIRKHRRLFLTAFALGGVFLAWGIVDRLGWYGTESRYRAAVALADRLDPGWREGVSSNSTDPIPDHENSAILVDSAAEKLPRGWSALRGEWPPIIINPSEPLPTELFEELRSRRGPGW